MTTRIPSFNVNHLKLLPGIYTSMKKEIGNNSVTTFDLRLCRPYVDPVLDTGSMHTIEHIGATYLRNLSEYKDIIVYFGPMGCRTGFYLILAGDFNSQDIVDLIKSLFQYIVDFSGEIPGASQIECGNYKDMNLDGAKSIAKKYIEETLNNISSINLNYQL